MSPPRFKIYPDRTPPDLTRYDDGPWIEATGGGLEGSIFVRVGKTRDGRPIITGLVLGASADREITADTLRSIRPRPLLAQLFEDFTFGEPPALPAPAVESELPDLLDDQQMEWGLMQAHVWSPAHEQRPDAQSTPARGPSIDQLRTFASIYKEQLRNPDRARPVTATAEAMHISRATANRWIEKCREHDLLPPK